jgi:hypothetical protein
VRQRADQQMDIPQAARKAQKRPAFQPTLVSGARIARPSDAIEIQRRLGFADYFAGALT